MNNDLISRKALIEDCLNRLNRFDTSAFEFENCFPYWIFHKAITEAPVVDAEPVLHGYNATPTHPSDQFVCSCCGFTCEITEIRYDADGLGEPDVYEYDCKYCPNCGARMEGENEA